MRNKNCPQYQDIEFIIFDFDGIFTDNKVYLSENGIESIRCDRGDGLAFNILRKFIIKKNWDVKLIVLSKEKNKVVSQRCEKLGLECHHGINDKKKYLIERFQEKYDKKLNLIKNLIYLGNDLNDLSSIEISEYSYAPVDSHRIIKENVDYVLPLRGGEGFLRSFIESIIGFDNMDNEQIKELL